jgi:sugar lactone lactonase YvrE/N-acetylneuraminic acid mutarotase
MLAMLPQGIFTMGFRAHRGLVNRLDSTPYGSSETALVHLPGATEISRRRRDPHLPVGMTRTPCALAALALLAGCSAAGSRSPSPTPRIETVAEGGQLEEPTGLAVDGRGDVIVADQGSNRILRIDRRGAVTPLAGTGVAGFGGDGGPAIDAPLNGPAGVAVAANGDVFVADQRNNRVRRIDRNGRIATVAGNGQAGFAGDGGPASAAVLNGPAAVAVDPTGNVFVADATRVRRVDRAGRISTVAGGGADRYRSGTDAPATAVDLGRPTAIAFGPASDLYIAVAADNWVLRVGSSGRIRVAAGGRADAVEDYDGPGAIAMLKAPTGLASDGHDHVFVSEAGAGRVRRLNADGTIQTVVPAGDTALDGAGALALGRSGALVLAEPRHGRVVRVQNGTTTVVSPPKPTVASISPSNGGAAGQAVVAIRGGGFSALGGTTVTFGGRVARVLNVRPDSILVSSPAARAGEAVDVVVSTRAGRSSPSVASRFTYETGWELTGSLAVARMEHSATTLLSGQVLVAGGGGALCFNTCSPLASTELYDPTSGRWLPSGSMSQARMGHTASRLSDGRVLVVGGEGASTTVTAGPLASAEIFDPATSAWTATASMGNARVGHTATVLRSGKVLVEGGSSLNMYDFAIPSSELYDPVTGTWTTTGRLRQRRVSATATLLPDGRVLVAGGLGAPDGEEGGLVYPLASAELYDPGAGTWSGTGDMAVARYSHTATLLPGGEVLVVGGQGTAESYLQSAELFDPATGAWRPAAIPVAGHAGHIATLLPNGSLLVAGGGQTYADTLVRLPSVASAEVYDPVVNRWTPTRILDTARGIMSATLLTGPVCGTSIPPRWCGAVLVAGGGGTNDSADPLDGPRPIASAELYR